MREKPKWWYRTLAAIPYLLPLHATWTVAESVFRLSPFLEEFEFFADSFNWYVASFPPWFWMAYSMAIYLGIVRQRRWPHFLRFHVATAVLLENLLEVASIVGGWLPATVFRGKAGLHFWTATAVAYLFTVLECVRCALAGMYADVPFVGDAAYMQCDYF
ncbi:Protein TIC 20-I, chloroplastic [Apostasia shenzhenica]|uniref:Protein TIC 20 n=1 Tax=Apostasia shenzhenica TaxID=1088818 RepID=A0A2I0AYV4_9ASPA|nr:Protein TIC 20-I, chloroplastic [Apostasia shenzhenica]